VFPVAALLLSLALPVRRDPGHRAAGAAGTPAAGAAAPPSGAVTTPPIPALKANTKATVASVTAAD
jgi:hypothetical protein